MTHTHARFEKYASVHDQYWFRTGDLTKWGRDLRIWAQHTSGLMIFCASDLSAQSGRLTDCLAKTKNRTLMFRHNKQGDSNTETQDRFHQDTVFKERRMGTPSHPSASARHTHVPLAGAHDPDKHHPRVELGTGGEPQRGHPDVTLLDFPPLRAT